MNNREIAREVTQTLAKGKSCALATIVSVSGSAYKKAGAKMFIAEDGRTAGLISGGCLEADVALVALEAIRAGKPTRRIYDLGEDLVWGLGLGCPGTLSVYIEPIIYSQYRENREQMLPFESWLKSVANNQTTVLATRLDDMERESSNPLRLYISADGTQVGSLGDRRLEEQIMMRAIQKMDHLASQSEMIYCLNAKGQHVPVFLDIHVPDVEILIMGAGHDAIPLAALAHGLGFQTTIVDSRPEFLTKERFPEAELLLVQPDQLANSVKVSRRTYIIIMNHHLEKDKKCLQFALKSPAPYVGLLGPKKRREKMVASLNQEGITFTEQEMARLRNPIGLDIGADGPEQIAVSILAELLALRNQRDGGFLNNREKIHALIS